MSWDAMLTPKKGLEEFPFTRNEVYEKMKSILKEMQFFNDIEIHDPKKVMPPEEYKKLAAARPEFVKKSYITRSQYYTDDYSMDIRLWGKSKETVCNVMIDIRGGQKAIDDMILVAKALDATIFDCQTGEEFNQKEGRAGLDRWRGMVQGIIEEDEKE